MIKKKQAIEELLEGVLVPEDEQPFLVPENWIWVRTQTTNDIVTGSTPAKKKSEYYGGDFPFVKPADLEQGSEVIHASEYLTEEGKDVSRIIPKESTMVCCIGSIGKAGFNTVECTTNQQINSLVPNKKMIDPKFNYYQILNGTYQNELWNRSSATTVSIINKGKMSLIPYVFPPLNEQKRIAEKVERLLSKVDEAKQLIEEAKKTFELRRAAILDKAFRGDLTRKWREENADIDIFEVQEHLDRLRADKESSPIKSNTLNVKSVNEDDEPFNLPRGWKWARLGELSYYVTSGSRDWSKYYANHGSYFIRTQDINKNKLNLANVAYVLLPEKVEGKRSLVEPFDLLTTITGANVGKCAIVEEIIPEAYVSQSVALTKLIDKSMAQYVHLSLLSTCGGGGELENRAYGIGRPVLSLEDIKNIRLPIAPYRERQVIINMVKKLLDMEETTGNLLLLEEKLDQLKNSILSKAFRGEIGTNDPSEESALELLKEMLQEQVN
ncbi:restriction endonuclease subunit S [Bacillus altitudinis]|uniref:restriction endonuclease subunit S n=1 Tax=Bacillus altitudinis TaxID=293387 RepID=UPI001FAD636B|nr:restriction endonuclease subunit S [Bacillus altitudinis]MCI9884425.1 restriction endonuclease subunit S [Bacillus altitudinis]WRO24913.1 restriction endonuclease subunit S [Bacillus altitudinis]